MDKPTEEGRKRYPPDGMLELAVMFSNARLPCQCTPECKNPCDGQKCGCRACQESRACLPAYN
jgi:hypothetical protein